MTELLLESIENKDIPLSAWLERLAQIDPYQLQEYYDKVVSPKAQRRILAPVYKKVKIPAALRWQVFKRDNFTCQECGRRDGLTADHIIPESKGGPTTLENLQTLCKSCNSRKGAK